MEQRKLTFITSFALLAGGCATYQFTELENRVRPARAPSSVAVFLSAPPTETYKEVGVIEADASSFAEAKQHFQALGGANGCHAVRAFDNRTRVGGTPVATWSVTTYIGSCLIRVDSDAADANSVSAASPLAVSDAE